MLPSRMTGTNAAGDPRFATKCEHMVLSIAERVPAWDFLTVTVLRDDSIMLQSDVGE